MNPERSLRQGMNPKWRLLLKEHDIRLVNAVEIVVCLVLIDCHDEGVGFAGNASPLPTPAHCDLERVCCLVD